LISDPAAIPLYDDDVMTHIKLAQSFSTWKFLAVEADADGMATASPTRAPTTIPMRSERILDSSV
jgi:hypothetical protein